MKNGTLLSNKGFLENLYKMIGLHLHKNTIMNQLHIHGLYNLSYFKGENQLHIFLQEFKMNYYML